MSDSPAPAEVSQTSPESISSPGRFFSARDWMAAGITGLVAFIGYVATLAPSVTLEDSGEFLTAMHQLGVPHPPGYPSWTILAWLWQWIVPFGNIAWRGNLMSAFFSAGAVAMAALLISKTGHQMCRRVEFFRSLGDERLIEWIVLASSVSASLMLAFSPVMWSQAVITEVYGLNAFFLLATLTFLYRWSFEPGKRWRLYVAALLWGIGLTSHQTQVLLVIAFPAFIWFVDRKLGRDALIPILVVVIAGIIKMAFTKGSMFRDGPFSMIVVGGLGIAAAMWLWRLVHDTEEIMRRWRQVLALYAAVVLGLALYGYMPVSSATNPPMNWGYTRTTSGFMHHFTRGQYDKVRTNRPLIQVWGQVNGFFSDLQTQYNILFALLALVALFFYRDLAKRERDWLKFLLIAFAFLSLGFLFLSNPTFEKQKQETDRVFFLPAHCLYAFWIGYGLILGSGYLFDQKPATRQAGMAFIGVVFALPLVSVVRNWSHQEERGHTFGYEFGYRMFKPGGDYPEMERGAILYGGTDPGRFVPTYMIFVESQVPPRAKTKLPQFPDSGTFDRRDVYIITQNALADDTYMKYIRDHYDFSRPDPNDPATLTNRSAWQNALLRAAWRSLGRDAAYPKQPIWIPTDFDAQTAFQQYFQELQTRAPLPGEEVHVDKNGRVNVTGVAAVMAINGYITKMIFDKNKDQHAFYIEESFVLPWMYPYLEPYGIILKLNREPLAGPEQQPAVWEQIIARDRAYWDKLAGELKANPKFHRDDIAPKTFAKLRSAIGGVYAARRMAGEAEYAFRQAIGLSPDSPEANFRLAQLYCETGRFDDGAAVLENYLKRDPHNAKIKESIGQINELKKAFAEERQAEEQYRANPNDIQTALRLLVAYTRRQRLDAMDALTGALVSRADLSSNEFLVIAKLYADARRFDRLTDILTVYVQRFPKDAIGWYNLAIVYAARQNCDGAFGALQRALALESPAQEVRKMLQTDQRFVFCRKDPRFEALLAGRPIATGPTGHPFTITP